MGYGPLQRFIFKCTMGMCLILALIFLTVAHRVLFSIGTVAQAARVQDGAKYLCVGSSLTGCAIAPSKDLHVDAIWRFNLPWQFTLMRLKDMEQRGSLRGIRAIVLEAAYSTCSQNHRDQMLEAWLGMLPLSWRYGELLTFSWLERVGYLLQNLQKSYLVRQYVHPDPGLNITQRPQEWVDEKLALQIEGWRTINYEELMCRHWFVSLENACMGIVEVCKRNDIALVAVQYPMPTCYREHLPPEMKCWFGRLLGILEQHGIRHYDYFDKFPDVCFMDTNHLTKKGAEQFTALLCKEVLSKDWP